jgi:hypothetical protein
MRDEFVRALAVDTQFAHGAATYRHSFARISRHRAGQVDPKIFAVAAIDLDRAI